MTLDERINRASWYLRAIQSKAGSPEAGPIEVCIADHANLAADVLAIGIELARRYERIGGRR